MSVEIFQFFSYNIAVGIKRRQYANPLIYSLMCNKFLSTFVKTSLKNVFPKWRLSSSPKLPHKLQNSSHFLAADTKSLTSPVKKDMARISKEYLFHDRIQMNYVITEESLSLSHLHSTQTNGSYTPCIKILYLNRLSCSCYLNF